MGQIWQFKADGHFKFVHSQFQNAKVDFGQWKDMEIWNWVVLCMFKRSFSLDHQNFFRTVHFCSTSILSLFDYPVIVLESLMRDRQLFQLCTSDFFRPSILSLLNRSLSLYYCLLRTTYKTNLFQKKFFWLVIWCCYMSCRGW